MNVAGVPRTEEDTLEIIGKNEERTDKAIYRYDLKRRRELIHELLEGFNRRYRMCDLGCSNGSFLDFFKQEGFKEVHGVELSPIRAEFARQRGYDSVYIGKGQSTPFPENHFDVVVNQAVLVHVLQYEDRMAMIREAHRILRPGGLYIVSFTSTEGKTAIQKANRLLLINLFKRLKDKLIKKNSSRIDPSLYCRYWPAEEMERMLTEAGFEIKTRLGHHFYYPEALHYFVPLLKIVDRLLYKSIPYYGLATFISAVKK